MLFLPHVSPIHDRTLRKWGLLRIDYSSKRLEEDNEMLMERGTYLTNLL